MPLYFFHLRDGVDIVLDLEGREIESPDLIAGIALKEARAIIGDEALSGTILLDKHIDVEDEAGAIVHRLPFTEAVTIVPPQG